MKENPSQPPLTNSYKPRDIKPSRAEEIITMTRQDYIYQLAGRITNKKTKKRKMEPIFTNYQPTYL